MSTHNHLPHLVTGNQLRFAVGLTGLVLLAEVAGGLIANSLALLSDAGHVLTDLLALSLSWFGIRQAARPAGARMTFGYHRVGILIALLNSATIIIICVYIFYEAVQRLLNPEPLESRLMLIVAAAGLAANLVVIFKLWAVQKENLNIRSAFIHAFGDALSSLGVIVGAVVIIFTAWSWLDPILSVLIGVIIAFTAVRLVKEILGILLEATPKHVDTEKLLGALAKVPGVRGVHDLHVWTIAPDMHALSSHIRVDDMHVSSCSHVIGELEEVAHDQFNIWHTTFQAECESCAEAALYCNLVSKEGENEEHFHES